MIPGQGEITREELETVKQSIGRLWMAFWNLRHIYDLSEEDWSREIVEMIEACGGLENARERWAELKRKKSFVLTTEQKFAILQAIQTYLIGFSVTLPGDDVEKTNIYSIMELNHEVKWHKIIKSILEALDANEDELQEEWWLENEHVSGSTEGS